MNHSQEMNGIEQKIQFVLSWALGFAIIAAISRSIVLFFWGYHAGTEHILLSMIWSIPGQIICGVIPGDFYRIRRIITTDNISAHSTAPLNNLSSATTNI